MVLQGLVFRSFYLSTEENRVKASREVLEVLKILEKQALKGKKYFGGDSIGLVDISYGWLCHWFKTMEEVVGVSVLEPSTLPHLYEWTQNFREISTIKDNLPDYEKLQGHVKQLRQRLISKAGAGSD